ncbi:hypothetical protein GJ496_005858, partial [Pomphorhynchus laevis]
MLPRLDLKKTGVEDSIVTNAVQSGSEDGEAESIVTNAGQSGS